MIEYMYCLVFAIYLLVFRKITKKERLIPLDCILFIIFAFEFNQIIYIDGTFIQKYITDFVSCSSFGRNGSGNDTMA